MAEQNVQEIPEGFRMYSHVPQGSLWMDEPTYWRSATAAEWRQAAQILGTLMPLAEQVSGDPLVIAVGDAMQRAKVEAERADERESAPKNEHGYSLGEDARILTLLRRTDALNNARTLIEDHVSDEGLVEGHRQEVLSHLSDLYEEASSDFNQYRRDLREALA